MAKRKRVSKSKSSSKFLLYTAWTLSIIALTMSALLVGYYLGQESVKEEFAKSENLEKQKRLAVLKKLEESSQKKEEPLSVNKRLQEVLKKESKEYISASHEIDDIAPENLQEQKRTSVKLVTKPKLAIIIDDVGTKSQVKAIKSLQLPLTMSFLPPSKARPNTPKLAAHESKYMVHLPMEAQSFSAEEPHTLRVNDSQSVISQRIAEIKKLFPNVAYINNHTGSKFTSNEIAMNRLIFALNANNIRFIDSRTTAETKAPKVLKNFGLSYVARDIFLDHHMDKPYILEQIKKAVKVAKSHGTAIAIGHPHKNTLQALYESKSILKDVDIVFVDQL
ncbi:MAG: divergent polysaccharide deacetylase family protein [Campylobacterales bacterium]|nr:divergent polysaccharide deacetylase family protein [Campylobacterales bacterium]